MTSETVPRCESCGLRLEDPTATLCKSCAYRRKKQAQRAADEARAGAAAPPPPAEPAEPARGTDADELRERLRRVEETLREDPRRDLDNSRPPPGDLP